ncbi:MAG: hypothetical protein KY454_08995 [Actinobacteria bacterium]|nr:hypothetical protein [Actinomycetota bacterium]
MPTAPRWLPDAAWGEWAPQRFGGFARRVFVVLLGGHLLANALVIAADLIAVGSGMELLGAVV